MDYIKKPRKNKNCYTIIFIFFLLGFISAQAQYKPVKFEKDSLPNGLKIIYHVDKSAPVVVTVMQYHVGSRYEDTSCTGYAHFFEHLMFEATENIPRSYMDKYVEEAGGTLNASTSFDQTVYYIKVPANEIKLPLWLESQRMRKLLVDTPGVDIQRKVVLEEMKQRSTNQPYGKFWQLMCKNLFAGTGYGWEVIGSEKHIERATINQFKKFYDEFYQPSNATLVIAGDFDIKEAKNYVRKYFSIYEKTRDFKDSAVALPPLSKGYTEIIKDDKAKLPAVYIGYRGPSMNDSDYYAVSLLTDILASGESSRLYKRLVDNEQIALKVSAFPINMQYTSAIIFNGVSPLKESISETKEIISDEIDKVIKKGINVDELEKAKNITETHFIASKKDALSKARALAKYESYFGKPEMINTELDKYMKVTPDDIMRVAKKYFGTDKRIVLTFIPPEYKD